MKVLLSIKPEFAEKIFAGTKRYEFRRSIFKNPEIKTIVVYASSPVQKVIGEFDIDYVLNDGVDSVWEKTKNYAGISRDFFMEYFGDKEKAYAIKVKECRRYERGLNLQEMFGINYPPQSFVYV